MKRFFSTLPGHVIACFKGRMLLVHLAAILLTLVLVESGLDWRYFLATRGPVLRSWMFPAVIIGGLLPIYLPFLLIAVGMFSRNAGTRAAGWAIGQAEVIGAIVAAGYKALTGRAHPARDVGADLSQIFRFGFLRGGVFWGWPSSHTTIAFAMAISIVTLFPKRKWLGCAAVLYAFYVGLGVSMTIHWLSDFVAGALVGTVIGLGVGKGFALNRPNEPTLDGPAP